MSFLNAQKPIRVALAGNPNTGKTTLFNALTGTRQHVGNYPGVTVEKKSGHFKFKNRPFEIWDLPGTYSLSAASPDELVVRDELFRNPPDVVIQVVDASNPERHLYLGLQFLELGLPVVFALNMSDVAKEKGIVYDIPHLEKMLDSKTVEIVASKGRGLDELMAAVLAVADAPPPPSRATFPRYENPLGGHILELARHIERAAPELTARFSSYGLAIRLLENDPIFSMPVEEQHGVQAALKAELAQMAPEQDPPEIQIAEARHGLVTGICIQAIQHNNQLEARFEASQKVDAVLLNRALGLPIFLLVMYLVFQFTFKLAEAPMGWIETFFDWFGENIGAILPGATDGLLHSLIVDGIIAGVGGVIVFLPNILLLFLAIAFLEDTGYMTRAAFLMDRIMKRVGLHGKSFIPMLVGFGCSVPAIMACRTIESRKARITTILVTPFMSCGARLPIYALLIPAFFPSAWRGFVLWCIYLLGILSAIFFVWILRKTILKEEEVFSVMEIPPYRMPTFRNLLLHMAERAWLYLKKAGTIILGISIILWALNTFPRNPNPDATTTEQLEYSLSGKIGTAMEPIIKPIGFDWQIGTALIGALAAKEVFVSQLAIVFSIDEEADDATSLITDDMQNDIAGGEGEMKEVQMSHFREKLAATYSPLQGLCIMIFCLLSAPCIATFAICRRETMSIGWALTQTLGMTVFAWIITFIVYQGGRLFGLG